MEKSLFKPFLTVFVLMTLAVLALIFTVDVRMEDAPGVVMDLPDVLAGGWVGNELRYCHNSECYDNPPHFGQYYLRDLEIPDVCPDCGQELHKMSWAEYDALPKDTEFVKSVYTNADGGRVFTSIVLSGRERNSIHRPERCLKGQGNSIDKEYVLDVPLRGRKPLKVMVAELVRTYRGSDGKVKKYYSYYAYWFVGQDRETPRHLARMFWMGWDQVFRSVAHRWAYIAVSGDRDPEDDEPYKNQIREFVALLYPHLLKGNEKLLGDVSGDQPACTTNAPSD